MKLSVQQIIIYMIFLISFGILVLNRFTPVYINNTIVHFLLLFAAALTLTFIIAFRWFALVEWKSILLTTLIVFSLCFTKAFVTWSGDWKTQTVLYENKNNANETVDFQMRGDRFAFGYKRRIIKRERIMPFLDRITDVDTAKLDMMQWKRVNKELNEMNFPGDYIDTPAYQN